MSKKQPISLAEKAAIKAAEQAAQEEIEDPSDYLILGFVRLEFPDTVMYLNRTCIAKVIYNKKTKETTVVDGSEIEYHTMTDLESIIDQINAEELDARLHLDDGGCQCEGECACGE